MVTNSQIYNSNLEIGIALSHYHQKLGPQFVGISFNFSNFDSVIQYNVLQDSITSRSNDLALFIKNKNNMKYTVEISKIKISDPSARGGVQRYAVVILVPNKLKDFIIDIKEISDDFVKKLNYGANVQQSLKAWYIILNEQFEDIDLKGDKLTIIRKMKIKPYHLNLL